METRLLLPAALLLCCFSSMGGASADTRGVVTQSTPTDCGPAALATLLRFYLNVPAGEAEMMRLCQYQPERGTTLLGLEAGATAKKCAAGSFLMSWPTLKEQITTFPTPVIVRLLNPEPHFVVLLAIEDRRVFLADPGVGNIVLTRDAFLKRWYAPQSAEGFVFIVAGPGQPENVSRLRGQTLAALRRSLRNLEQVRARPQEMLP